MASSDLHTELFAVQLFAANINTETDTNTASVDTAGFESLEFLVNHVTSDGMFEFTMQESDDEMNWSDVSGNFILYNGEKANPGDLLPTLISSTGIARFGYVGKQRYSRLVITSLNSPFSTMIVNALLNTSIHQPTPEQPPPA